MHQLNTMPNQITTREREETSGILFGETLRAAIAEQDRERMARRLRHGAPGVHGELQQRMTECFETLVASLRATMAALGIDVRQVNVDWMPSGAAESAVRKLANVRGLEVYARRCEASEAVKRQIIRPSG
jgi:hypothetical protein